MLICGLFLDYYYGLIRTAPYRRFLGVTAAADNDDDDDREKIPFVMILSTGELITWRRGWHAKEGVATTWGLGGSQRLWWQSLLHWPHQPEHKLDRPQRQVGLWVSMYEILHQEMGDLLPPADDHLSLENWSCGRLICCNWVLCCTLTSHISDYSHHNSLKSTVTPESLQSALFDQPTG